MWILPGRLLQDTCKTNSKCHLHAIPLQHAHRKKPTPCQENFPTEKEILASCTWWQEIRKYQGGSMVCKVLGTKAQKSIFQWQHFFNLFHSFFSLLSFCYTFLSYFSLLTFIIPYCPCVGVTYHETTQRGLSPPLFGVVLLLQVELILSDTLIK